jgi:hypothetical protein
LILLVAGLMIVVGAIALWRYVSSYESTDDAQVDGHINSISARISGHVAKLNVLDNQYVEAGTVLVEIDPTDYQVALDRAKANYQDAEASASAARVNVPITSVSTTSQVAAAQANVENARAGIEAAKQQFQAANAQLQQAEANNAKAQSDLVRYQQLVEKQEISQQQYDQALAAARVSAAGVQSARSAADAAEQQVAQAQAKLVQAEADLRSAYTAPQQMSATPLQSPIRRGYCGTERGGARASATQPAIHKSDRSGCGSGEQPHGRSRPKCPTRPGTHETHPPKRSLGDRQLQRNATQEYEGWTEGHHRSRCHRQGLQRTPGQYRRRQWGTIQLASPGKRHRQLRQSCAAHSG